MKAINVPNVSNQVSQAWHKMGDTIHHQVEGLSSGMNSVFHDVVEATKIPTDMITSATSRISMSTASMRPSSAKKELEEEEQEARTPPQSSSSLVKEPQRDVDMSLKREKSVYSPGLLLLESTQKTLPKRMERSVSISPSAEGSTEIWLKEVSSCEEAPAPMAVDQSERMTLKVLRAKNVLRPEGADEKTGAKPTKLWIGLQANNSNLEEVAFIPLDPTKNDPIWGGPTNSFDLIACADDELMFWLDEDTKIQVPVQDLFQRLNPWLSIGDHAFVQLRLAAAPDDAVLHDQETCKVLTAGPALCNKNRKMMKSYVIRKQILYSSGTPVLLNVYDVSNSPKIAQANEFLKGMGAGGIFHGGIEIHGREYSFGGSADRTYQGTGIFTCVPKKCAMHHYRETVYLGDCELNPIDVAYILKRLEQEWKARSYNVFRKNCCFFSQELAIQFGVGDLPEWVYSLATSAESWEPTLIQLNQYLAGQAQKRKSAPTKKTSSKKQPSTAVEPEVHEAMLDHAMAAKIQRRFRQSGVQSRAKLTN